MIYGCSQWVTFVAEDSISSTPAINSVDITRGDASVSYSCYYNNWMRIMLNATGTTYRYVALTAADA